jgi:hypothetical protein
MPAAKWGQRAQKQRDLAGEKAEWTQRIKRDARRCREPPPRDRLRELLEDLGALISVHEVICRLFARPGKQPATRKKSRACIRPDSPPARHFLLLANYTVIVG